MSLAMVAVTVGGEGDLHKRRWSSSRNSNRVVRTNSLSFEIRKLPKRFVVRCVSTTHTGTGDTGSYPAMKQATPILFQCDGKIIIGNQFSEIQIIKCLASPTPAL
ncbi:hypothetical protein CDAR_422951 [Caerostris darwini]|uniref:Uncharacterized protein n=1 Tax=Caerostris darwini TaxID=1538125 RepID=A0AAV4TCF7_9ARAC|nr:hypothetical protein CDAR_422951 [Caerostris darwini]